MIYAVMPKDDYEHACDVLREYTGDSEPIKSGDLEQNIDKVYDAGAAVGEETGFSRGYKEGQAQGVIDGINKTKDATATPDTVAEDETFWAGGRKQTGSVKVAIGGVSQVVEPTVGYSGAKECLVLGYTPIEKIFIDPARGGIRMKAEFSSFGDVEARDVAKGKKFTSFEGLQKEGTGEAIDEAYYSGYREGYAEGQGQGTKPVLTQEKNVTPSAGPQEVEPDEGYYLSKVYVEAVPYRDEEYKGGRKIIIG